MSHDDSSHESAVTTYVTVAIILAVITYLEFALVEYDIGWLSAGAILTSLLVMSLIKFLFVIWFFMHLKDDEATYSGFFGSGMVIALGTFVVLGVLFVAPASLNQVRAQVGLLSPSAYGDPGAHAGAEAEDAYGGHGAGLSEEDAALIESDGYSRALDTVLATPRPKNQRVSLTLPAAPTVEAPVAPAPALFDTASASTATDAVDGGASDSGAADAAPSEPAAQAAGPMDFDAALGEQGYANCVGCHQAQGQGLPGVFPPLAGNMPVLVAAEGGRAYLISTLLYGLQGQIEVDGRTYNGVMPPWAQLPNEQIAAVLNHELVAWGNVDLLPDDYTPITADEVAAARGQGLSPADVLGLRQALELP